MSEKTLINPRFTARFEKSFATEIASQAALRRRLSMNEMTTYRWTLSEDVAAYRKSKYHAMGVWRQKLGFFGEAPGVELIRREKLNVSSVSWVGGFTGAHGHGFDDAVEDARNAIRIAGDLNADAVVVVSGPRAGHTLNHARRLVVEALRSLADEAALAGTTLSLTPMHPFFERDWTFLTSLDAALDVIAACDHPAVKLAFDAYHLWETPRLFDRIREVAPLTGLVQLSDAAGPPRNENDRLLPGEGRIPLDRIVPEFTDAGYQGFFEVNVWSESLWASEDDYALALEDCRKRFHSICNG